MRLRGSRGGGGVKPSTKALLLSLAALLAAVVALDLAQPVQAQSDDEQTGRIVARRLDDGRTEFGWQPTGGARVLPTQRYFPTDAEVGRWLNSSPVEVEGEAIGRINARMLADGRIEFAFTPTDGERIEPSARYFPTNARINHWLRSTEITISTAPATGFVAVSAGESHTCAIRAGNGAIECWGDNDYGQIDVPPGRFSAVSAGKAFTCAIRAGNGEIECWGSNEIWFWNGGDYQFVDAPAGPFTAVSAGGAHACGLRTNGAIECWTDKHSQAYEAPERTPPPGRFTAVSAGYWHTCAIRTNGAIECWGDNNYVQTDALAGAVRAVSASHWHTCVIRNTGAIECWGDNDYGQADPPTGSFTAVSADGNHTCAIRESGAIECWGNIRYAPSGSFTAVSAGGYHTCAIRESGAIECWGWGGENGWRTIPPAP